MQGCAGFKVRGGRDNLRGLGLSALTLAKASGLESGAWALHD